MSVAEVAVQYTTSSTNARGLNSFRAIRLLRLTKFVASWCVARSRHVWRRCCACAFRASALPTFAGAA